MKKTKPVEARSRQRNWQLVQAQAGLCPRCGQEKRDVNQRTGKPYSFGPHCRKLVAAEQAAQMRRRREKGIS